MSENKRITNDNSNKIAVLKELEVLKKYYEKLEVERNVIVKQGIKHLGTEFGVLDAYEMTLSESRKTTGKLLVQDLDKIKKHMAALESKLKNNKPNPTLVKILNVQMEQIENNISLFKNKRMENYEQLLKQERFLNLQLKTIEEKFQTWGNNPKPPYITKLPHQTISTKITQNVIRNLPSAVANFERFIQRTGPYGFWTNIDHEIFLRAWNKITNKENIVSALLPFFPFKTSTDITNHVKWYEKYERLLERKKTCIQLWRAQKLEETSKPLKPVTSIMTKQENEDITKKKIKEKEENHRQEVQKKLEKWKQYKENQKILEEKRKEMEECKKQVEINKQKGKQLRMKLKLQYFQIERERKEKLLKKHRSEQQMKQFLGQNITKDRLHKFQEKDYEFLQKRQIQKKIIEEEGLKQKQRIEHFISKIKIDVKRDFQRVLQPTQVWLEKLKYVNKSYDEPETYLPHRAIPVWRQKSL